jgi:tetratricopeptide (TPR) repeat protein
MLGWMLVVAGWAQELGDASDLGSFLEKPRELEELTALLTGTDAARMAYLHRKRGELLESMYRNEEALADYRAAVRLLSGAPKVDLLEHITRLQGLHDLDGSIETTQQAILLAGALPDARIRRERLLPWLAQLHVAARRTGDELRAWLAAAPRSISSDQHLVQKTLLEAAFHYTRMDSFEEALALLEPLLVEDPSALQGWSLRFYALTRLGRTDLTAELTALGAAFPGPYDTSWASLSQLLLTQGWREDAPESARLALDLWLARFPDHPQAPEVASRRARLSAGG